MTVECETCKQQLPNDGNAPYGYAGSVLYEADVDGEAVWVCRSCFERGKVLRMHRLRAGGLGK